VVEFARNKCPNDAEYDIQEQAFAAFADKFTADEACYQAQ
jgi:hypothetical protein